MTAPLILVLNNRAEYYAMREALSAHRERLAWLEHSDLGPDAKAMFKVTLGHVEALLVRVDALDDAPASPGHQR